MEGLTAAIEKGNEKVLEQMQSVSTSMHDAAEVMRGMRTEISLHRQEAGTAVQAAIETRRLVGDIHKRSA